MRHRKSAENVGKMAQNQPQNEKKTENKKKTKLNVQISHHHIRNVDNHENPLGYVQER